VPPSATVTIPESRESSTVSTSNLVRAMWVPRAAHTRSRRPDPCPAHLMVVRLRPCAVTRMFGDRFGETAARVFLCLVKWSGP
jgi:hypothetical protein